MWKVTLPSCGIVTTVLGRTVSLMAGKPATLRARKRDESRTTGASDPVWETEVSAVTADAEMSPSSTFGDAIVFLTVTDREVDVAVDFEVVCVVPVDSRPASVTPATLLAPSPEVHRAYTRAVGEDTTRPSSVLAEVAYPLPPTRPVTGAERFARDWATSMREPMGSPRLLLPSMMTVTAAVATRNSPFELTRSCLLTTAVAKGV